MLMGSRHPDDNNQGHIQLALRNLSVWGLGNGRKEFSRKKSYRLHN